MKLSSLLTVSKKNAKDSFKRIRLVYFYNTVEPRSTSASLYKKFALRAAIRKNFYLIRRVKVRSTSDRSPSTSRDLKIQFQSL